MRPKSFKVRLQPHHFENIAGLLKAGKPIPEIVSAMSEKSGVPRSTVRILLYNAFPARVRHGKTGSELVEIIDKLLQEKITQIAKSPEKRTKAAHMGANARWEEMPRVLRKAMESLGNSNYVAKLPVLDSLTRREMLRKSVGFKQSIKEVVEMFRRTGAKQEQIDNIRRVAGQAVIEALRKWGGKRDLGTLVADTIDYRLKSYGRQERKKALKK